MKKTISVLLLVVIILSFGIFNVGAAGYAPYVSYEYNKFDEAVDAPVGYEASLFINSDFLNLKTEMNDVQDIVIKDNNIFILDSGNSRIIVLDENYRIVNIYDNLKIAAELAQKNNIDAENGVVKFTGAQSICVGNGMIYIADTDNNRVLCVNINDFEVTSVILRPDSALNDTDASFSPIAVEVDNKGWLYVSSGSITSGIMVFNTEGEFQNFFGANTVGSLTDAIVNFFKERFMTETQKGFIQQNKPVVISNMDFDSNGFLYTVSPYKDSMSETVETGLIKKLNYDGDDILDSTVLFGDLEAGSRKTWFTDIDADKAGFINIIDGTRGRIFQYTDSGILVSVFGAISEQKGGFTNPSAVESFGSNVLVADSKKNCIIVFEPTEYGKTVRSAVSLMNNNDFSGSEKLWNELLSQNSNSQLCYEGLGRISEYNGKYKQAMSYYKLAYDQDGYATAFKEYRQMFIENNIVWLLLCVVLIVAAVYGVRVLIKKHTFKSDLAYSNMEQKRTIEFYSLIHPIDGFSQVKQRDLASYLISGIIVLLWFLSRIAEYQFTGFAFSINRNSQFNLFTTFLTTIGLFIVFVISNWALCALIDGGGNFKNIVSTTAYSLIPFIITRFIMTVMTNVFVPSESVFVSIVSVIGILWSFLVLLLGLMTIHEFSVSKTVFSLLLTLLGMAVIVFLAVLIFSLIQQMANFIISVYKEIIFRM